jgi:DNA helicase-2/ATP-dependent DNA helicase PcrA
MTIQSLTLAPIDTDDAVDEIINGCLTPTKPKSFFLYAGAGSGKTRSLERALKKARKLYGAQFRKEAKRIAVITYTNAACDVITSRVEADPLFAISTIHSFCWSQIGTLHADIQAWLKITIPEDIADLESKQAKGRGGQASIDRERSIENKRKRLQWLSSPRTFTYNPNGDNAGQSSLSHIEVLKIAANFISTKPSMQVMLVNRFPFLLIDESQDTNKILIDAFFSLELANRERFALGLFGDTMQRIYADGKPDLGKIVPAHWEKPRKKMNHRCPQRVIQLANTLRSTVDGEVQMAREDSIEGVARLFITSSTATDKQTVEASARAKMAEITGDGLWNNQVDGVKTLILEHHMAASRMGFLDLFTTLDKEDRLTTGLRTGELSGLRLFSERVAPLIAAASVKDDFGIMAVLRKMSPLLKEDALLKSKDTEDPLAEVRLAVDALLAIDTTNPSTKFLEVLQCVAKHGLFEIPEALKPFALPQATRAEEPGDEEEENDDASSDSLTVWRAFLETSYCQIIPYASYVSNLGAFATHQGVKGDQFERVFVVIDDEEARGFLFPYDKLFGTKPLSDGDKKKIGVEETGLDRTRRLLYVTCTRAEKSLAIIVYTNDPAQLATTVTTNEWFDPSEIINI